jgi:Ca2+/Na+ antiporter
MQNTKRTTTFKEHSPSRTVVDKLQAEIHSHQKKLYVESVLSIISSLLGAIVTSLGVSRSFSTLPRVPQAYVYLIGIILSCLAGILIIFISARKIYQERRQDRMKAIEGVRLSESDLFKTFQLDFENIINRRELHG